MLFLEKRIILAFEHKRNIGMRKREIALFLREESDDVDVYVDNMAAKGLLLKIDVESTVYPEPYYRATDRGFALKKLSDIVELLDSLDFDKLNEESLEEIQRAANELQAKISQARQSTG